MKQDQIPIVIPVYNPPHEFEPFIRDVSHSLPNPIVCVNDGSDRRHRALFQRVKKLPHVILLTSVANRGKGAALQLAFSEILSRLPDAPGAVTADADGQHTVFDIQQALTFATRHATRLGIGTRTKRHVMPIKSRTGNALTRITLSLLHKAWVRDTQSGLRYVPRLLMADTLLSMFSKYDFELDMLIRAVRLPLVIDEFEISTIYLNKNRASHYKVVSDSVFVAKVFLHYVRQK